MEIRIQMEMLIGILPFVHDWAESVGSRLPEKKQSIDKNKNNVHPHQQKHACWRNSFSLDV